MNFKLTIALIVTFTAFSSYAERWNEQQTQVWNIVLASYEDIEKRDNNWTDKWVTEDAMVWGNSTPMPRGRSAVKRWEKFSFEDGSTNNVAEYSPTAIVVHGDTAVAHYYYSNGTTAKKGEQKVTHGRCSDVLVKDDKAWKFVAWHCAEEAKKY
ncbi:nuclear transport factor 2 family protein [Colwellia sp. MB3u-4]|uniref:YybH family protein n=1 Tax=Colwellia sp. MB3u-4 TaxID=2759822 RepID=UPI0015F725C7|nr:nuclear transport factor 2 family protein [Colwellia sp. MB3u-4]MBA6288263.1 nuclear transport factor 2 family protein [Colwellia sp. MB3u-4]